MKENQRMHVNHNSKWAVVALVAAGALGCAAKPYVCPIIKLADSVCQSVVVQLPDGTTEEVPKAAIMGVAMGARAQRMGAMKAADAGVDGQ
jgi:hypothetical protein